MDALGRCLALYTNFWPKKSLEALGQILPDFLCFSTSQDSAVINQAANNDQAMNMLGVIHVTLTYDFCEGQL